MEALCGKYSTRKDLIIMTENNPEVLEKLGLTSEDLLPEEEIFEETLSEFSDGRGDDEDD